MEISDKIYFTLTWLLVIPFARICFHFLSKKTIHLTDEKNNSFAPLLHFFLKFFKFYAYYFVPTAVLIMIISKWLKQ